MMFWDRGMGGESLIDRCICVHKKAMGRKCAYTSWYLRPRAIGAGGTVPPGVAMSPGVGSASLSRPLPAVGATVALVTKGGQAPGGAPGMPFAAENMWASGAA